MASQQSERKLAAILAADVVGYSRLMGEDEAGTARAVRESREAARPLVEAHGGRIVKTMGDGVLLEFPSLVAAVECAVAVQKLMAKRNEGVAENRRIVYRIGVHLGDVLIDGEDILGDGVNIAARLEGIAEPGGICLSGSAYEHVRGRVGAAFVDLGERALKNIARPVRVYSLGVDTVVESAASLPAAPERSGPPRLSIVVLPFANIGGDPEQEYFVDGVTESLTTDLSRIRGSFVIGRHTAFTYKGKSVDLRQIGRELNVRYVLEGSVQRGGARMRVNAQLIDAESGNHLWSQRFDKPVAELFEMQDEIVAHLARQMNTALIAAEARRAERAPHPDSMDLYFQGMSRFHGGKPAEARVCFEHALALDRDNVDALTWIAFTNTALAVSGSAPDPASLFSSAEAAVTRALSLAPEHGVAHLTMGYLLGVTNRGEAAIAECERALALDPSLVIAHGMIGLHKLNYGRGGETEAHVKEALRLSPRDHWAFMMLAFVGFAKNADGLYEEAVPWLRRSIEANRNASPMVHFHLAVALAHLGRLEEAREVVAAGLALDPQFTIEQFRAVRISENPVYLAARERIMEGMRKAGLPEQ